MPLPSPQPTASASERHTRVPDHQPALLGCCIGLLLAENIGYSLPFKVLDYLRGLHFSLGF